MQKLIYANFKVSPSNRAKCNLFNDITCIHNKEYIFEVMTKKILVSYFVLFSAAFYNRKYLKLKKKIGNSFAF